MFCNKCGATLEQGASFCVGCGAPVANDANSTPAAEPAYTPAPGYDANYGYTPTPSYSTAAADELSSGALSSGIMALIFAWVLPFIGSILGFIFSGKAKKKAKAYYDMTGSYDGRSKTGKILGTIAFIVSLLSIIFWVFYIIFIVVLASSM